MQSCPCSIFDLREEQILEANGSLCIRLICNVCGSILDSKMIPPQEAAARLSVGQDGPRLEDLAIETGSS
ncbi:MAG: hypothetical protein HY812_11595 [Planctomycetes bacterium]|nr:hypothetical protein [Planctomycetota bacterium]